MKNDSSHKSSVHERILESKSKYEKSYSNAVTLFKQGKYDDAIRVLKSIVEFDKDLLEYYHNQAYQLLGDAYLKKGMIDS